jgi:anti-sigma B factor antagonist
MASAIKSESQGGVLVVSFTESRILDEAKIRQVGDELVSTLNKTDEEKLLLDFRGVSFMSSAMLGTLVRFHKKCKEFKVRLKLCNIAPDIFTVFKITRLDKVFDIHDDASAAQAAFQK